MTGRPQIGRQEKRQVFGQEARSGEEAADALEFAGAIAGLLLQLAMGRRLGILDHAVVHVEGSGGQFQQGSAAGQTVLSHQQETAAHVERGDHHGSRVEDDVARRLRAVGSHDGVLFEGHVSAAVDLLALDDALFEVDVGAGKIAQDDVQSGPAGRGAARSATGGRVGHGPNYT